MSYSVDVIGGISVYELALLLAWRTETAAVAQRSHKLIAVFQHRNIALEGVCSWSAAWQPCRYTLLEECCQCPCNDKFI